MAIRIELFGNLQITHDQAPISAINTNRLQSLLAFLALHSDSPQPREQLAALLWPESEESQARTNLRQLLHHLRRALPAGCNLLETDNRTVLWRRDPECFIDTAEFDRALDRANAASRSGDARAEREALEEAARLCQDDLLRGLFDQWVEPEREQYRERLAQALSRLAALLEERRDYAAAIPHAERLVTHDPLRETHHQMLIRLHAANGDRASALRAYHQCMRVLRRELAVEPEAATRELFERVLKSEAPAAHAEPPSSAVAPAMPLVGRKREWDRLLECWRGAAAGPTRLALISGEPGIGKSRLAEELVEWCARRQGAVARARCYAAHGQLAYAPIAEWLRGEPLREARARLPKSQLAELARVLPEILAEDASITRPHPLTESWERHHFFESLTAALAGARKPLLLVIDDLQWCDPDSLEWMHWLFRADSATGILVLGTVRPEETGRSHPFTRLWNELKQHDRTVELALAPLDAQETAALAGQVATRSLDAVEMDGIYRATEGNPLFVVESVRAGLQGPRIHAVIGSRLAQLSPSAYELAGLAGAIGQSFSFDLLAKASDWDEDSLARALDELWQRSLIHEAGAQYDFTHDRIREVAYSELSPVRRRFWHRRIARALEELHAADPASVSGQLAAHYEAAGMVEQAIAQYRDAASVAQQRFADAEATVLLRRALVLCRKMPESARRDAQELDLLVTLGPALVSTQGYAMTEVGESYARALELSQRLGDRTHLLSILSGNWVFHVVRCQLETSRQVAEQFLAAANAEGVGGSGHFPLGSSMFHLGRLAENRAHMEQALADAEAGAHPALKLFASPDIGVFSRSYLSHVLWLMGHVDQSHRMSRAAIEAAQATPHPFAAAIALDYAALLHLFRRESATALRFAEEAAAVCRRNGFVYYLSMAEIVAGWAMGQSGEPDAGLARLRMGMEALRATGAEIRLSFYYGLLAETCALAGHMGEAMANISSGFAFQNKSGEVWAASDLHRVQGDLLAASGNKTAAAESFRRAMEAAQPSGARTFELRAAVRLWRVEGSPESRDMVESLLRGFTEGFDTQDLQDARSLAARARR
jgi:DNA-binding SARP family transcriptional activator/predicted ATPase